MGFARQFIGVTLALTLCGWPSSASAKVEGYPYLDNETIGLFNMVREAFKGPTEQFDILHWGDISLEKTFGGMLGFTRYLAAASAHAIAALAHRSPAYRAPYQRTFEAAVNKMLHHRSWGDWLAVYGDDPIAKDNLMFKGFLFYMLVQYQQLFGDRRYEQPLTLVSKQGKTFSTDIKSLAALLAKEQANEKSAKGEHHHHIACEPGQVFVICNTQHRVGFELYDRMYGTKYGATAATWIAWANKNLIDPATGLFYYMYRPAKTDKDMLVKWKSGIFNSISIAFLDALDTKLAMGVLWPKFKTQHVLLDAASPHGTGTAVAIERPTTKTDLVTFALNIATTGMAMIVARSGGETALAAKLHKGWEGYLAKPAWEQDRRRYGYSFIRAVPLVFQNAPALWARATDTEYNLRLNTPRTRSAAFFKQPHVEAVSDPGAFVNQAVYDAAKQTLLVTINGGQATTKPASITVAGLDEKKFYGVTRDGNKHPGGAWKQGKYVFTTAALSATEETYRVMETDPPAAPVTDEGCSVSGGVDQTPPAMFLFMLLGLLGLSRQRSGALLCLTLVLVIGSGCNLIFKYEDRAPDAASEDAASDGPKEDGPGDHDPDISDDAPRDRAVKDRSLKDNRLPDRRLPDRRVPDRAVTKKDKTGPCPSGWTQCGGMCVNTKTSLQHCGKCNSACSTKTNDRCLNGVCSCGYSGAACVGGLNCKSAKCQCIQGGLCSGCCSGTTTCRAGTATSKCGKKGAQCKNCNDGNDCTVNACSNGGCTKTNKSNGSTCDSSTGQCAGGACCKGCRSGNSCLGGTSTNSCGDKGAACKKCPSAPTCKQPKCSSSGVCTTTTAAFGTGCLGGTGTCVGTTCCTDCVYMGACNLGTSNYICGKGGITCQNCTNTASTKLCVNQVCSAGLLCGAANCATGCCDGNTCKPYNSQLPTKCGQGGVPCKNCYPQTNCTNGKCH